VHDDNVTVHILIVEKDTTLISTEPEKILKEIFFLHLLKKRFSCTNCCIVALGVEFIPALKTVKSRSRLVYIVYFNVPFL
jgi:hypothetical protein